jgi:hypothetical protein
LEDLEMLVSFYSISDSDNTINKTLVSPVNVNVRLNKDFNQFDPVLMLASGVGFDPRNFNYFDIPTIGRKYFIREIENKAGNIWAVTAQCDYLESFKSDIMNSKARYYRKMKVGDYVNTNLLSSNIKTVNKYNSNVTMSDEKTMILTTLGA